MSTLWIAGGSPALAETVRRHADAAGRTARVVAGERPDPAAGDALLDLGAPPPEWPDADLEAAERDRVAALAAAAPRGLRVVRLTLLGAAPDAHAALQRAHAAAEEAWRATGADLVILRHGLVLGPFGLASGWRRLLERSPLVPVPGFDSRFEPILDADLAAYCAQAAEPARPLDPIYDLGCGDMMSHGYFVRALATELGRSRLVLPAPGLARGVVARGMAGEDLPASSAHALLEVFAGNLLPRRMNAWEHFDVKPAGLDESLTRSVGKPWSPPPEKPPEPFGAWRRRRKRPRPFLR